MKPPMSAPVPLARGEETRAALIAAALGLYGDKGYEATSTREIAAAAGVNSAMIAYHFGGKEGLRAACAEHVAERLRGVFAEAPEAVSPQAARAALAALLSAMVRRIVADEAARPLARFLLREIADPSPAFAAVYESAFAPLHARACRLFATATGAEPESEATRLHVFALIGQTIYFRIARAPVLLRMGWREIGAAQAAAIETVLLAHLDAALDAARRQAP
jgi:TetR/AcrR family transcriptional regulator, regulator of cefoperazone and chloramphenicol sensitivity